MKPYSQPIQTSGGTPPITFSIQSGAAPAGLALDPSTGVISGTPSASGPYSFTVMATDASRRTATQTYSGSITPAPAITTAFLPAPVLTKAYSQTLQTTGGTSPLTFAITAGALPAGLTLDQAAGTISGTPTTSGTYNFTVTVTDANGVKGAPAAYNGYIAATPAITTATLPTPILGRAYGQQVLTRDGTSPVILSVSSGALPGGLTLDTSSNYISGTPTTAGPYSFTITATDANGLTASQSYSGTIAAALTITTTALDAPVYTKPYSQTIQTSGGTPPMTFTIVGGQLPTGLNLDRSTGTISGTPTSYGFFNLSIEVNDVNGVWARQDYSATIAAPPSITTTSLPTPVLTKAYWQTIQTTDGTAPITFSVGAGLPLGLSLDSTTGVISGTPTASGNYLFRITATDANGLTGSQDYTGTIADALTITTVTLPVPALMNQYNQTIATSGGTGPITFAVTAGALPANMSLLASNGLIFGTPSAPGPYNFTITATDTNGVTASQSYSGTIAGWPTITTTALPVPVLTQPYNQTIQTSGGTAPIAFAVTSGTLPAGLSLDASSGTISGTPTASGAYNFTVTATDANGLTTFQAFSGRIAPALSIATSSLPWPILAHAYSQTIATTGGRAPVTFAITGGTLPAALTLNSSTGSISGIPVTAGAYSFTVTATDANSTTASQTYSGTIAAPLAITSALPVPVLSKAYSQTIQTSGGIAPITLALTAGVLPPGLAFDANTDVISGTPSTSGGYGFTITATDNYGATASRMYIFNIAAAPSITTATLPVPVLAKAYSQTIHTSGGIGPITFAVTAGTLPAGLALNAGMGAIDGTPTTPGDYNFTVTATDANGLTGSQIYSGTIAAALAITTATLPVPVATQPYNQTIRTSGGTAPITFAVTSGALPAGLSLDVNTGVVSGTSQSAGAYTFTVTATDANGFTASQSYSGTIADVPYIMTLSLPVPVLTKAYSQTLQTSGGTAPITFAITGGALPAGLALDTNTGTISGTPTAPGSYDFTVTVTDAHGLTASRDYAGTIAATLAVATATVPTPIINQPYSQTITTSGGTAPISYAITAGALPAGLTAQSVTVLAISPHRAAPPAGLLISGTPTTAGAYSFTVTATDANGFTASQTYSGTIAAALNITTPTVPPAESGQPYQQQVQTSGGLAPFTFAVTSGSLPPGFSLDANTGIISGTPGASASGSYTFTVTVTDANAQTSSQSFTISIEAAVSISTKTIPAPEVGVAYNATIQATGGSAPYTFAVTTGALPAGLSLAADSGVISGTATKPAAYSFTLTVTDANGVKSSATYSGSVQSSLVVSPANLPRAMVGVPYSQTVRASGGIGPYALSVSSGALPAGLTFDASTGVISGRATHDGTFTFAIQAQDASGATASVTYAFVVDARPDPSQNADVRGLVAAQTNAMAQFTTAQTENVLRHLEDLHWGERCAARGAIQLTGSLSNGKFSEPDPTAGAAPVPSASLPLGGCMNGRTSTWLAGSFEFGSAAAQDTGTSLDFHTNGVTGGLDHRFSKNLVAGLALGGGFNGTAFGTRSSSLRASTFAGSLYASYHPTGSLFLDGLFGTNNARFDDTRWNAPDSTVVPGHRTAAGTFATLVAGFDYRNGRLEYAPYLRGDAQRSNFTAMTESSDAIWGLTYGPMSVTNTQLAAGLRLSYDMRTPFGLLSPNARLEFHQLANGAVLQNLMYQDGLGPSYLLSLPSAGQPALSGAFGLHLSPNVHTVFEIEYDFFNTKGTFEHTLRPYINLTF